MKIRRKVLRAARTLLLLRPALLLDFQQRPTDRKFEHFARFADPRL